LGGADVRFERKPSRDVIHDGLCIGAGSEYVGMEALKLQIVKYRAADSAKVPRRFVQDVWPDLLHLYEFNSDITNFATSRPPYCWKCCGPCTDKPTKKDGVDRVDIMSGGTPCTPFTRFRFKSGSTARTGSIEQHPDYEELMEGLPAYLEAHRPRSFWIEEVDGIILRIHAEFGKSHLQILAEKVVVLGYSIRALVLEHKVWMPIPRRRCFLIGVSEEAGGAQAATWATAKVRAVMAARQAAGEPKDVWEIIDMKCKVDADRLQTSKADHS